MTAKSSHYRLQAASSIRDLRQRPLGSTIGGVLQHVVQRFEKASEGQDEIRQILASYLPERIPLDTIKEVRVRGRLVQLVVTDHGFKFHIDRWVRAEGLNVIRRNAKRSISSVKVLSR